MCYHVYVIHALTFTVWIPGEPRLFGQTSVCISLCFTTHAIKCSLCTWIFTYAPTHVCNSKVGAYVCKHFTHVYCLNPRWDSSVCLSPCSMLTTRAIQCFFKWTKQEDQFLTAMFTRSSDAAVSHALSLIWSHTRVFCLPFSVLHAYNTCNSMFL